MLRIVGAVALAAVLSAQTDPGPTFGSTVTDNAGFRGTIYFLKQDTGVLPETFRHLKPKGTIYTRALNIPPRHFTEGFPGVTKRLEWFAIDYKGRFWIESAGLYEFALTSDDGSQLYIDEGMLIDNDGLHPSLTKSGRVELERGVHDIRVSYFQGPRDAVALILEIAPPGEQLRVFSMDEFRPHSDPNVVSAP